MRKNNFFSLLLILSAIVFLPANLFSRVSIGSTETPQPFSVLELFSNETMGFRLPQLTEYQRDNHLTPMLRESLPDPLTGVSPAMGLRIFNTCNQCVETWNGEDWISFCIGETPDPCAGLANLPNPLVFCEQDDPTIADLTAEARRAGGRGIIEWFSTETGGDPLLATQLLTNTTYWAGNCAGATARTSVTVSLADCSEITPANIRVTAFVNVMYDFQHQELISFVTAGGEAIEWQWQVSTARDGTYTNIPGATSATWTVPVDLIHKPALVGLTSFYDVNELFFNVKMKNPASPEWREMPNTNALGIRFIPTTVSGQENRVFLDGFGIDANGVRYVTMSRARHLQNPANPDFIRVALLNLGAAYDDGVGLGNFFQWGRIADGHEQIVWGKNAAGNNYFAAGTSGSIQRTTNMTAHIDGQGQATGEFAGNFITFPTSAGDWGVSAPNRNELWGNGNSDSRDNATLSLTGWTNRTRGNNPCLEIGTGWRVPSPYDWIDMNYGDGRTDLGTNVGQGSWGTFENNDNTWTWRVAQSGAVGGAIISNSAGGELFLPAAGGRHWGNDNLISSGTGNFWSSVHRNASNARNLTFSAANARFPNQTIRSTGMSVRCVADE